MQGIRVCGRQADRLNSRGFGRRTGKCILLSYEEALYLAEREMIDMPFEDVFREASRTRDFDVRFFVYRDLRSRGYVISVKDGHFHARKSYSMDFYPMSDLSPFDFDFFSAVEKPAAIAVVDGDGDVTYYMLSDADPRGERFERPAANNMIQAGNRVFILDDSVDFGTFGKNEGKFAHLSVYEARYLAPGIDIDVDEEIYEVYRDLRDRGLIVKSGFKYGTHFRVYERSIEEHSRYLVHVVPRREEMQRVSRAVRVAHGVRKELLLAKQVRGELRYLSISWIRP